MGLTVASTVKAMASNRRSTTTFRRNQRRQWWDGCHAQNVWSCLCMHLCVCVCPVFCVYAHVCVLPQSPIKRQHADDSSGESDLPHKIVKIENEQLAESGRTEVSAFVTNVCCWLLVFFYVSRYLFWWLLCVFVCLSGAWKQPVQMRCMAGVKTLT